MKMNLNSSVKHM